MHFRKETKTKIKSIVHLPPPSIYPSMPYYKAFLEYIMQNQTYFLYVHQFCYNYLLDIIYYQLFRSRWELSDHFKH